MQIADVKVVNVICNFFLQNIPNSFFKIIYWSKTKKRHSHSDRHSSVLGLQNTVFTEHVLTRLWCTSFDHMVLHNVDGVSVSNLLSSGLALRKTYTFIIQVCAILQPFSYFCICRCVRLGRGPFLMVKMPDLAGEIWVQDPVSCSGKTCYSKSASLSTQ